MTALVSPHLFRTATQTPLLVRRVEPGDAAPIVELLYRLSERSRWLRYFTPRPFSPDTARAEAERIVRGHRGQALSLIAIAPGATGDQVLAVAELVPEAREPDVAAIAIVVRDDYQRQGIGQTLARYLVQSARLTGLTALRADLLAENRAIRRVLDRLALPYTTVTSHGETTATLPLATRPVLHPPAIVPGECAELSGCWA